MLVSPRCLTHTRAGMSMTPTRPSGARWAAANPGCFLCACSGTFAAILYVCAATMLNFTGQTVLPCKTEHQKGSPSGTPAKELRKQLTMSNQVPSNAHASAPRCFPRAYFMPDAFLETICNSCTQESCQRCAVHTHKRSRSCKNGTLLLKIPFLCS